MTSFNFNKLLIAYDGSELAEKALKVARELAVQDEKIELHILHVFKPLPSNLFDLKPMFPEFSDDGEDRMKMWSRGRAEAMMREVKGSFYTMANPVIAEIVEGYPEKRVVEYAEKNKCDLIIMGCRGLGGLKELFLGSVSHYVVQHAHVPIFIIK